MIEGLVLDNSTAGLYTSQVFDAGGVFKWKSIGWVSNVGELPDNRETDKSVDMSDNVLLLHLNQDASDSSGLGHNGTVSGTGVSAGAATAAKFGQGGYAANNTADGGHIAIASSPDFNFAEDSTDGFSFFTWFSHNSVDCKAPDNNNNESMASRLGTGDSINTWWFGCGAGGDSPKNKLVLEFYPTNQGDWVTVASGAPINDGNWHHGGWVYDPAGQVRLYLDGVLVDSAPTTPGPFTSANSLCIGAYGAGCNSYEFVGNLDEVAVFKRALNSGEVKGLYTRGVAGLNLQVRACDDAVCNGGSWVDIADESPQSLSLSLPGRYFQYKFNFTAPDTAHSPELYSVTIQLPSADIDSDGVVDGSDLYLFMLSYGKSTGTQGFDTRCDFDGNQTVNANDLATFAAKFGK